MKNIKFLINALLFLALAGFCLYWFDESNISKNDPGKIPYVGRAFSAVSGEYVKAGYYIGSGQGDVWDYLKNLEVVRPTIDRIRDILDIGKANY